MPLLGTETRDVRIIRCLRVRPGRGGTVASEEMATWDSWTIDGVPRRIYHPVFWLAIVSALAPGKPSDMVRQYVDDRLAELGQGSTIAGKGRASRVRCPTCRSSIWVTGCGR